MMRKLQSCVQCQGITKAGRRCSIDSHSKMKTERGKLVGEPLLHGSRFCSLPAQIFQYEPVIQASPTLLFFSGLRNDRVGTENCTNAYACLHTYMHT